MIRESEFSALLNHAQMFRGCTALHYAVLVDDQASVRALLEAGADPGARNEYRLRPEEYAKDIGMRTLMRRYGERFEEQRRAREAEQRRKFPLEQRIRRRLIGQAGAIAAVSGAIRRKENGWHDEARPLVFLFLGSSGIGKTELAKTVAEYLHKGSGAGFIRIDMSEYQHKHEVGEGGGRSVSPRGPGGMSPPLFSLSLFHFGG